MDGTPGPAADGEQFDLDGVWDFRAEFGLLFVNTCGHHALGTSGQAIANLQAVMASDVSGVERFRTWTVALARRLSTERREIVGLGSAADGAGKCVSPEQVVLPGRLREQLLRDVETFADGRSWYEENGLPWRRGVMLYGPPGNGKTTVARMLAGRMLDMGGCAFAFGPQPYHDSDDLHQAFKTAAKAAPALLVLEDIDTIGETEITRAALLGMLDGSEHALGVFVVATTNFAERVDPALVGRAGRFDRSVHVPYPDADLRRQYLSHLWAGRAQWALLESAVDATVGLSIAALNEVHYHVAMRLRDGEPLGAALVHEVAGALRRVETAKRSGDWERGGLGFRAEE